MIICKAHAGKLAEAYYRHCLKIRQQVENYSVEDLRTDLRGLIEGDASDSIFRSSLAEKLVYKSSVSPKILHFLSTLEDYRSWYDSGHQGTPEPDITSVFDISSLQVEHIYPQNARNTNTELEPLKHNLGNLSFWSGGENNAASNVDFPDKKTSYARASVSLNRDLADFSTWNQEELEKRREQLVDMAVKVFTI